MVRQLPAHISKRFLNLDWNPKFPSATSGDREHFGISSQFHGVGESLRQAVAD
jgi:hypothetical protein